MAPKIKKEPVDKEEAPMTMEQMKKMIALFTKSTDEAKESKKVKASPVKGEARGGVKSTVSAKKMAYLRVLEERQKQVEKKRMEKKKIALQKRKEADKVNEKKMFRGKELAEFTRPGDTESGTTHTSIHKAPCGRELDLLIKLNTKIAIANGDLKVKNEDNVPNNLRFGQHTLPVVAKLTEILTEQTLRETLSVSLGNGRTTMHKKDFLVRNGIRNNDPNILSTLQMEIQADQQAKEPKGKSTKAAVTTGSGGMPRRNQKAKKAITENSRASNDSSLSLAPTSSQ